ncbi:Transcriptional regulator, TetR family [Pseudonocardia sp. Ae168_Ps1]|uniref:TetR/AcrR family transcriptional regulator n=1 Tax=unclassified Pseudonocardia TaxID=2619320 RepID=UPI00094ADD20|nr:MULTISPECIES: TetR family transcriptional regulator [unclassified Pseudonocardia]OLL72443.1 Transcriptional regulator, TetR family [Pseudonocardia sp. Ae150A_Ps1]OLL78415.1 Transcriptional regulator, TetR family [Pseudonocardia sp. Ae168_Ps1]OLL87459.1 Transcriptional regulator, TetR family [Pseudonocardia sp. Ae263_Ps1]OLL92512.1 Transcriptional regulator, TetR family [Pseudonocardia sp. Ae356_Ps1]
MSEQQAPPGRRERKKAATRAALAAAALQLCSERGLDQVTVKQIADAADVAPRTFFNYFTSKEEAIVAGNAATADTLVAAFTTRPDDEPVVVALRHALRAVVTDPGYLGRVRQMRALREYPTVVAHHMAAFAAQEQALAAAVVTRTGTDPARDLFPTLAAAAAVTGLRVAVQHWLGDHGPDPRGPELTELVDEAMAVFDGGLRAVAGAPA